MEPTADFPRPIPSSCFCRRLPIRYYGFAAVNVERQRRNAYSLLNWTKRAIAVRKAHRTFGRGTLRFLRPGNRKILAYLREYEGETILCVANLARVPQAVELDLSQYKAGTG